MDAKRGKLIYFEGGEGSGKKIHTEFFQNYLEKKGINVICPREPGGTNLAEDIRNIVLDSSKKIDDLSEIYLFQVARSNLHYEIILPALKDGVSILQDRSKLSSLAYQGYARGGDIEFIKYLNKKSTYGIEPDLVFIIDVDPQKGLEKEMVKDRFSKEEFDFHVRVNEGYLKIARQNLHSYIVIPYIENGIQEMQDKMKPHIDELYWY